MLLLSDILQVNLPEFVSKRYDHSISVFTVGLNSVWIVVTGGGESRAQKSVRGLGDFYVSQPNITIVVELSKYCTNLIISFYFYSIQ